MGLGSFLNKAIPVAIAAATGGPVAAFGAAASVKQQERQTRIQKRQLSEIRAAEAERNRQMSEIYGTGNVSSVQAPLGGRATTGSGFGAGFGTFLGDVGRNIITPISSVASQILPFKGYCWTTSHDSVANFTRHRVTEHRRTTSICRRSRECDRRC
jgi:hypothetical protein